MSAAARSQPTDGSSMANMGHEENGVTSVNPASSRLEDHWVGAAVSFTFKCRINDGGWLPEAIRLKQIDVSLARSPWT
jgi:hypothetical protein